jgi:hypothetical protein
MPWSWSHFSSSSGWRCRLEPAPVL